MSFATDDDIRYDDDYSHFRQLLTPTEVMDKLHLQSSGWPIRQIKVVKQSQQSAIILNRRDSALRRIGLIQSELGRMQKLLDELRADVLHMTVE